MSQKIRLFLAVFVCLIAALVFASIKSIGVQNSNQNNNASQKGACEQACTRDYQTCRKAANANQAQCKQALDACRAACKTASPSPAEMPTATS